MINKFTDKDKARFLRISENVKWGQGPFLAVPLLSVYENPEDYTYTKEQ